LKSFQKFSSYMRAEKHEAKLLPNWCVTAYFCFELATKVGENRHLSRLVNFNKMKLKIWFKVIDEFVSVHAMKAE
jgi:hypothetical protein